MKNEDKNNLFLNGEIEMRQGRAQLLIDFLEQSWGLANTKEWLTDIIKGKIVKEIKESGDNSWFDDEISPEALELIQKIEAIAYDDIEFTIS